MSDQNPLKLDVGLSAKAEIKAEIPTSSVGRLVDALTDAIRPFTEARGLRADQIRLQREDVMIQIALKARERIEIEGGTLNPIPPRLLVPLIEKASLTDPADEFLMEKWANLMVSASKGASANQGIYIDILSKLDPVHLKFLEFLAQPYQEDEPPDSFLHLDEDIYDTFDEFLPPYIKAIKEADLAEEPSDELSELCAKFFRRRGSCLIAGTLEVNRGEIQSYPYEIYGQVDLAEFPEFVSGALESLNLIQRRRFEYAGIIGSHFWAEYHVMTLFGLEFFYAGYSGRNIMSTEV